MNQLLASPVIAALADPALADDIRRFIGPLAAVIIGVMGLRYLVGDQKSLAGFVGFLFLGIAVYSLIQWGEPILGFLGGWFIGMASDDNLFDVVGISALSILGLAVAFAIFWFVRRARTADGEHGARGELTADPAATSLEAAGYTGYTEAALVALTEFAPVDLTAVDRLRNQVRLTVIIAVERGVLGQRSPVTPAHLAKWVTLRDRWPEVVDALAARPDLLATLENEPLAEFAGSEELSNLLRTGPSLRAVAQTLLHMTPFADVD
jgi:hypothetical protein